MHRLFIWFLVFACLTAASVAQDLSTPQKYGKTRPRKMPPKDVHTFTQIYVNGGLHTEFFNNIQTDGNGTLRKFDTAPTLGLGVVAPINEELELIPEFNWVLPRRTGGKIMKNVFMLRADLGYLPVDWFRLRAGTSIMWLNQHGSGGSTKINNGNDSSTFYYPNENRSSFNNTLDIGGEFLFDEWAVRLQTYTYALFKEERRQLSYTLFVSYYWDR